MWTLRKKKEREGGREAAPVYIYRKDPPPKRGKERR